MCEFTATSNFSNVLKYYNIVTIDYGNNERPFSISYDRIEEAKSIVLTVSTELR